jgi:hypothetical protein
MTQTIKTAPGASQFIAAARRAEIRAMVSAPVTERAQALRASAAAAEAYYATPEGEGELADWRALQGEDFRDA